MTIWAIVGIDHCSPIWLTNDPKMQEGCRKTLYRARIESIKSSGERSQKVELKVRTNSENEYIMSVWSCVNGHFTGKPHRDRVELDHILSWITCFPLQLSGSAVPLVGLETLGPYSPFPRLELLVEMQIEILHGQSPSLFPNEPFQKRPVMTIEDFVLHSDDPFESHFLRNEQ